MLPHSPFSNICGCLCVFLSANIYVSGTKRPQTCGFSVRYMPLILQAQQSMKIIHTLQGIINLHD